MIVDARVAVGAPWAARALYALHYLAAATGLTIRRMEEHAAEETVGLLYAPPASLAAAKFPAPASGAPRLVILIPACGEGQGDAALLGRVGSLAAAPGLPGDPTIPLYGGRLLGSAADAAPRAPAPAGTAAAGDPAPILSASPDAGEPSVLRRNDPPLRRVIFRFDLLANVFIHLARLEETLPGERDRFGRFPAARSVLTRDGALETPVVDRLAAFLLAVILREHPDPARIVARVAPWPDGGSSAILLTHDVDQSVSWPRRLAKDLGAAGRALASLRVGEAARGLGRTAAHLGPSLRDPLAYPRRVHAYERSAGVRSSWYFLTVTEDDEGRRYDVGSEPYRRFLKQLEAEGSEVGLHGSIQSSHAAAEMARERGVIGEILGHAPAGNRQHYLTIKTPRSFRDLAYAGFAYDASVGYSESIGFRAGASFPFRPYDVAREESIDLIEIPFGVMDVARIQPGEEGVALDATWRDLLDRQEVIGGLLAVLWHPRMFDPETHPSGRAPYESLVAAAKARGLPFLTAAEIARWWRARETLHLVAEQCEGSVRRYRFASGAPLGRVSILLDHRPGPAPRVSATSGRAATRAASRTRAIVTVDPDSGVTEFTLEVTP